MNIKELIEDPSKLNAETLPKLKALVEKYPFFQVVRLLYISNLYKLHSQDFGAELRKASSFVPDRTALFMLTEGVNYTLPTHSNDISIETEDEGTRTISLIDRFLNKGGIETDEDHGPQREQPSLIDLRRENNEWTFPTWMTTSSLRPNFLWKKRRFIPKVWSTFI